MRNRRGGRRFGLAVILTFAVVIGFTARLVDIQVVSASTLTKEAKDRRELQSTVYGARGDIVDRNGNVLADSVERYDITVSPKVALGFTELNGSVDTGLQQIAAVTGQDPAALMAILTADPTSDYAVLAKNLTLAQYQAIDALDIPWVYAVRVPARSYPDGALAGNLIGFLGTDEPLAGLERSQNACLIGQDGVISYERSEDGVRIPDTEVTEVPAIDGGTLKLTIDRDLQWYIQEEMAKASIALGATWASAAVVRISDGALMAVTDYPTLDPNRFSEADPGVTGSRAFAIPYEPGSIMKPINAAIAIDLGVANPDTALDAPYSKDFGPAGIITDAAWHDSNLTLTGSLVYSSNVGTSDVASMMPSPERYDYLHKFGFDKTTEVDFTGESAGYIPALEDWDPRTTLVMGYGQALSATILQMASAYQTIGNNGLRVPLKLVESCTKPDGTVVVPNASQPTQVISPETSEKVRMMMEMVYEHNGLWDDLNIPGYRLGVKSGTGEVAENGQYTNKVTISYAGIVPIDRPEYAVVISVGVPWAAVSGQVAATFHNVVSQLLTMFRVAPSSGQSVQLPITW